MGRYKKTRAELLEELQIVRSRLTEQERACAGLKEIIKELSSGPASAHAPSRREVPGKEQVQDKAAEALHQLQTACEELQVAEEELRQQNEELAAAREAAEGEHIQYQDVFDSAPDGYLLTDAGGIIRRANQVAEALLNVPPQDLSGKPLALFIASDQHTEFISRLTKFKESGESEKWEMFIKPRNRDPFHAEISLTRADNRGSFRWLIRDIAGRKQVEQALRDSEADLNRAQAVAHLGSWRFNKQRKELFWSDETSRIFGFSKETPLTYQTFFATVHPEDQEYVDRKWTAALRGEPYDIEHRVVVDGRVKWVREKADLEFDAEGKLLSGFGTVQDITERKLAEKQLKKDNRVIELANRILEVFVKETGDDLYDKVLNILLEGLASRHGVFGYIDEQGDLICPTMSKLFDQCEMPEKCFCYPPDRWKGLWGRSFSEKRTLYSNAPAEVPPGHVPIRNNMAAPILFHDNVIGLINLANKETDYIEEDREFIEAVSNRIAPTLYAQVQKELREKERKVAQEALREAKETAERRAAELNTVFDSMNDFVLVYDAQGNLLQTNAALKKYMGMDPDGAERRKQAELLQKFEHRHLDGRLRTLEERPSSRSLQGETVQAEPWLVTDPTGRKAIFAVSSSPIISHGQIIGAVTVSRDVTERQQAELEIKKIAEKYSTLFNSTSDGVWIHNLNGEILEVNDAYCRMSGYSRNELIHMPVSALETVEPPEEISTHQKRISEACGHDRFESRHRRKDGSLFDVDITALHFEQNGGRIAIFVRDITGRKRAEEELRKANDRVASILSSINDGFYTLDNNLVVTYFNKAAERILNRKAEDVVGRPLLETFPETKGSVFEEKYTLAIKNKISLSFETYFGVKPYVNWYSVRVFPFENGISVYFLVTTEQKQAQQALERKAQVDVALAEISGALTQSVSLEEISDVTLRRARSLTQSPYGFAGYGIPGTGHFISATLTRDIWEQCQVSDKSVFFENLNAKHGLDGWAWEHRRPVLTNNPCQDPRYKGPPPGHVPIRRLIIVPALVGEERFGMIALANSERDYTEEDLKVVMRLAELYALAIQRKQADEALRESEARFRNLSESLKETVTQKTAELLQAEHLAAVGQMVATVAHEIRNPIQIIRTGVDSLRIARLDEQLMQELLEEIEYGAAMLEGTILEVLQYSRPLKLEFSFAPLKEVVEGALRLAAEKTKNINKRIHLEDGDQEIWVDAVKFTQVLVNVISNAADAMPGGGTLTIHSRFSQHNGETLLDISITDTGHGIDERLLQDIYKPFFTTKTRGTGLGLSLCKKIMDAHRGAMNIKSKLGEGTTVELTIPIENRRK